MSVTLPSTPPEKRLLSRGRVLFIVGLVMVIGISLIAWRSTQHFLRTAERVAHSREILETDEKVLRYLTQMESARRGFLIGGNEKFATDFENSVSQATENLKLMRKLTTEDAGSRLRLDHLDTLLTEMLVRQRSEMDVRREGGTGKAEQLFSRSGSDTPMREIQALLADMEEAERLRLSARSVTTEFVAAATTLVIIIGSSVAVIALLASGVLILRDFAARRRAEAALAEQARLLTDIIDTMPEMVFLKDKEGRYVVDNRAHRRYLGVHPGESLNGKTVWDLYPRDIAERAAKEDEYVLSTGAPIRNREEPGRPAAPNIHWLSTTKIPLRDGAGRIVGLVGVSVDITKRKEDEEKLQRFAAQLERNNAELQNFASVASHDLQEPLRKIQAFSDRLRAKCSEQLNEQGLDYLGRMEGAARRMQTLIQDLLQLSRVTSRAQPFERCDLGSIIREVVSDLEVRVEQTQGRVEIGDLPTIDADPLQMRQLFQNLIANALKFHRPEIPPIVRVTAEVVTARDHLLPGARPSDRLARITVQDNGIGFDPKFAEQIFVVFQRLHSKQEYEGTGIGLAVCRKITDRHGGNIMAQSIESRGSTFIITLPVKQHAEANPAAKTS